MGPHTCCILDAKQWGAYGAPGSETNIMVQAVMVSPVVCHSVLIAGSRKVFDPSRGDHPDELVIGELSG